MSRLAWVLLAGCAAAPAPAPAPLPPPRPPEEAPKLRVIDPACAVVLHDWQAELKNISFAYDTANLSAPDQTCCALVAVAALLEQNPSYKRVAIEVHSDERGSQNYNLQLSQHRAESIVAVLIELGVNKARLVAVGEGELCPLDPNHNEKAWTRNRRVVLTILDRDGEAHGMTASCNVKPSPTSSTTTATEKPLHCK